MFLSPRTDATAFANPWQVPVWSAAIFGAVSAVFVSLLKRESAVLLRHDKLHVFAVHAGGGLVGMCLTGVLAEYVDLRPNQMLGY